MPQFIFLGRQCRVASDDFYFPAIICCFIRSLLIILAVLYIAELRSCSTMQFNRSGSGFWFANGTIVLHFLFMLIELGIFHISSKGTIATCEHRILLQPALLLRSTLSLVEFAFAILGIYLAATQIPCTEDLILIMLFAGSMLFDVFGSFIFGCCAMAGTSRRTRPRLSSRGDPYGNVAEKQSLLHEWHGNFSTMHPNSESNIGIGSDDELGFNDTASVSSTQIRHWETKCQRICAFAQCMTCNLFGGAGTRHDSMSLVAEVMVQFFYGEPDLVLSDIIAGFVLLNAVHSHDATHSAPIQSLHEITVQIPEDETLDEIILDLAYFSKYAVGIYGWMLYVWSRPWKGMFQLLFSCCKTSGYNIVGDNCLHLHLSAFLLETKVKQQDIVYANFSNNVCQPAYAIVLDHTRKTVVITVRGTLSLEDCLTDVIAHGCLMDDAAEEFEFDGHGGYAHHGMLHAALWLRRELEQLRILEVIYGSAEPISMFQNHDLPSCSQYQLLLVGHSLGAGAATLLSMMLRPKYPQVKCYAYSAPGCVLSKEHAEESKEFVTSCVLGNDLVARSSLHSIKRLRNDVLDMIERSKVSKREILQHMISCRHPDELLHPPDEPATSDFCKHLRRFREMLQNRVENERSEPMFPPGKIVHLDRYENISARRFCCCREGMCCTDRSDYEASWSSMDKFANIKIARTMLDDHFPDKMHHVLGDVASRVDTASSSSSCFRRSL